MKILTLLENTTIDSSIQCEHGLSQYIETEKHKILFDSGASDAFYRNALTMGIDLKGVDTFILSHGHSDHSGGVMTFAGINPDARIYMHTHAEENHWNAKDYIGIDLDILNLPNLQIVDGNLNIDDELFLFSDISGSALLPPGNKTIYKIIDGEKVCDDFLHEQNLVITENGKKVLFSGCAHRGIVNIIERFAEIFGSAPDYCIGGFHLMKNTSPYTVDEIQLIKETAARLFEYGTICYTGHCTSQPAFDIMKEIMGDRLHAFSSGNVLEI